METQKPIANGSTNEGVLSLWDAVSIIVGIVVGVSIFKVPNLVFLNVSSGAQGLGVWLAAGILCFVGALCYAELATRCQGRGGEYLFLTKAYGPFVGFLYGWAQLAGVFSGAIGSMAFTFSDYGTSAFDLGESSGVPLAIGAIATLTAIHILGVRSGKTVQNILTISKVLGLFALLAVGFGSTTKSDLSVVQEPQNANIGFAMIMVLYAYGGWNDAAFVASEVKDPQRNIPRALAGGVLAIISLYLLVNWAYFRGLGLEGIRGSSTPASDLMTQAEWLGPNIRGGASRLVSILVMTSALGAVHGLLFTGSRLYSALGVEHSAFARLGHWHSGLGSPVWALVVQAAMTSAMILAVGTEHGRNAIDGCVTTLGRSPIPWSDYYGGFNTLVAATAPVFWAFFLLNGIALFVLRSRSTGQSSGFRVPLYPLTPIVFCLTCVFMLYQSLLYAGDLTLIALIPLAAGIPLWIWSRRRARKTVGTSPLT